MTSSISRPPPAKLDPTLQFAPYHRLQDAHPVLTVVQAWHRGIVAAAVGMEELRIADAHLLQRLQAVGGESRHHHQYALHSLARQLCNDLFRVRLGPFGFTEPRLVGDHE